METLGLVLTSFGGVFVLSSALALAFTKDDRDEVSAWQRCDVFILGGLISLVHGLIRGIANAVSDRSSSAFVLTVVFFVSAAVTVVGVILAT